MQTKTKIISHQEAKEIQEWLDGADIPMEDRIFSFSFEDDIEIDVQVITDSDHAYLNVILFKKGREIEFLDPAYTILGEYIFKSYGDVYRAVISQEPPNSVKYFTEK